VYQAKGGWLVAPPDGVTNGTDEAETPRSSHGATVPGSEGPGPESRSPESGVQNAQPAPQVIGTTADGVAEFRALLGRTQIRRWPMYLRNVKQVFRQASPVFDERAYGFASLVDLLRAAQKEGIVRMDRDRQGVVRVFQGTASPVAQVVVAEVERPSDFAIEAEVVETTLVAERVTVGEEPDLSVGPGNVEQPVMMVEPGRRRARTAPPRARAAGAAGSRRPRKKAE